jgi:EamA-like transporter family
MLVRKFCDRAGHTWTDKSVRIGILASCRGVGVAPSIHHPAALALPSGDHQGMADTRWHGGERHRSLQCWHLRCIADDTGRAFRDDFGICAHGDPGIFPISGSRTAHPESDRAAYFCWFYAIRIAGPQRVGNCILLVPLFGAVLGVLLLSERFTGTLATGGAMIFAGVALSLIDPGRRSQPSLAADKGPSAAVT